MFAQTGRALQIVRHSRTNWNLESLVNGWSAKIEIRQQDSFVSQLGLGQGEIGCRKRLTFRRRRACDDQGMEWLQRLQMVQASAQRAELFRRSLARFVRINEKRIAQGMEFHPSRRRDADFDIFQIYDAVYFLGCYSIGRHRIGVEAGKGMSP